MELNPEVLTLTPGRPCLLTWYSAFWVSHCVLHTHNVWHPRVNDEPAVPIYNRMSLCSLFETSQNIMSDVGEKAPFCYLESQCPPLHCTEVLPHLDVHHWQLTTVENCLSCSLLPLGHPYKTQYEIQMSITLLSMVFVSHFLHCVYIHIYVYSIHINATFLFPLCKSSLLLITL